MTEGSTEHSIDTKEDRWLKRLVLTVTSAVILLWILLGWLIPALFRKPGTLGEQFGAVNALFTGFAFAGVIIALWLQRKELQLQREELRLTREEITGQKEALRAQVRILQVQQFEGTFYNLLGFIKSRSNDYIWGTNKGIHALMSLDHIMRNTLSPSVLKNLSSQAEIAWNRQQATDIDSIMNLIIELLYYVKSNPPDESIQRKRHYIQVARSMLPIQQIRLLFYWAIREGIAEDVRDVLKETNFFSEVDPSSLYNPSHRPLLEKFIQVDTIK